ncbi:hypothetical protein [Candidatus Halocynthiibacter alkanivorans]|jgi:hypothetical protein|uniref:hypothetical protein n=1 Tax=Candidatus Halocynthiibacter alkanivorans TaxID=2267619 RepID=UPI00190F65FF|nr:hypothetical protein [Candidatus Halocynthiibacter alkanivorans]
MIGAIRLLIMGYLALGVLFVLVSLYSRSVRREKLEKRWHAEGQAGERADFVRAGLAEYDQGPRKKLILLIFIVPPIVVAVMLYVTNFM